MKMFTAKKFFDLFQKKLCDQDAIYNQKSYREIYKINGEFTSLVNRLIVNTILEENKLRWSNEYYRIDVIGWENVYGDVKLENDYKKAQLNYHSWKLQFAFEHENNSEDWSDEVIKLLYINCPLRVVVGYNDMKKRDDAVGGDLAKLNLMAKTISELNIEISGEFLIIIGNSSASYNENTGIENYFGYRAYLYDNDTKSFHLMKQN